MDHSIIELARERARMAQIAPIQGTQPSRAPASLQAVERNRTQPNAAVSLTIPGCLSRWLSSNGDANLYWLCSLLFAIGVLLALSRATLLAPIATCGGV